MVTRVTQRGEAGNMGLQRGTETFPVSTFPATFPTYTSADFLGCSDVAVVATLAGMGHLSTFVSRAFRRGRPMLFPGE
jgi:hypothetical protein